LLHRVNGTPSPGVSPPSFLLEPGLDANCRAVTAATYDWRGR